MLFRNFLLSILCLPLFGQFDPKLTASTINPGKNSVEVGSGISLAAITAQQLSLLQDKTSWNVTYAGRRLDLANIEFNTRLDVISLVYKDGEVVEAFASDIPKKGVSVKFMSFPEVIVRTGSPPVTDRSFLTLCRTFAPTSKKDQADVDITGGFQAGKDATPQYFWSAKVQCKAGGNARKKLGEFAFAFKGEASMQRNADPDSLKVGLKWERRAGIPNSIGGFQFIGDALAYEFERSVKKDYVINGGQVVGQDFLKKNSNLMWTGMARWVTSARPMNITVGFAGFEAGRSLSRTIKIASQKQSEQPVVRLHFNADVYRNIYSGSRKVVIFHGYHALRLPLYQEPYVRISENGGKMYLTNKPRHYTLLEMAFPFNDGLAINVQYKRGSLPPSFEFVNHQVTIGFNLLLKSN